MSELFLLPSRGGLFVVLDTVVGGIYEGYAVGVVV